MPPSPDFRSLLREAADALTDVPSAENVRLRIEWALRAASGDNTCDHCGDALTQPEIGRRRRYCGGACRQRAHVARKRALESA